MPLWSWCAYLGNRSLSLDGFIPFRPEVISCNSITMHNPQYDVRETVYAWCQVRSIQSNGLYSGWHVYYRNTWSCPRKKYSKMTHIYVFMHRVYKYLCYLIWVYDILLCNLDISRWEYHQCFSWLLMPVWETHRLRHIPFDFLLQNC